MIVMESCHLKQHISAAKGSKVKITPVEWEQISLNPQQDLWQSQICILNFKIKAD